MPFVSLRPLCQVICVGIEFSTPTAANLACGVVHSDDRAIVMVSRTPRKSFRILFPLLAQPKWT